MNEKEQKEFDELAEEYTNLKHRMINFIVINDFDADEIWNKAEEHYQEDCSYGPNE